MTNQAGWEWQNDLLNRQLLESKQIDKQSNQIFALDKQVEKEAERRWKKLINQNKDK